MKFNQTCCADSGVPEECMGLCKETRHRRSVLNKLPLNRCDEHLPKIHSCLYEGMMRLRSNTLIPLKPRTQSYTYQDRSNLTARNCDIIILFLNSYLLYNSIF